MRIENRLRQGCSPRTPDSGQIAHSVTSEVEMELELVQPPAQSDKESSHYFLVPLLPAILEDDDGDIIVPRKQSRKRRKKTKKDRVDYVSGEGETARTQSPKSKDTLFFLEARSQTTWDAAGTQLWRAAFLLAEYIYSSPVRLIVDILIWYSRLTFVHDN
ncbi:unnamed protein product [Phytophthora fragariaefolia]|uniref:Unnamed protein product n=1 Tax=Phytophthora fragariaefolia TaxID=1490495 RepID=A0A9W6XWC4_9STRA|nr:unnamed protein product [Phytophthora fragariaefolia]